MRTTDGRMDAFKFLLPAVQRIPDKLERAAVVNDLAGYLGVDPGLVLEQFKRAALDRRTATPAVRGHEPAPRPAAASPVAALERILLNALLSSAETREQILPRLTVAMTSRFSSQAIFDALRQMAAAGAVTFSELDARLDGPTRALLHDMVTADEMGDDAECLVQAEACLRRLEEDFRRRQIDELRARVKTAEREGKSEEALQWFSELHRLEQEVKGE
jgi:DNA primase